MKADTLPQVPLSVLEGGASSVVLCPTARLADELRRLHGEAMVAAGHDTWQALEASTPAQWLDRLCSAALLRGEIPAAASPKMVLVPAQEARIWERAIARDVGEAAPLFDLEGMAATAIEADRIQRDWGLHVGNDMRTPEAEAFGRWQAEVASVCRRQGWYSPSQAWVWWLDCLERGVSGLPAVIGWAGFAGPDPARERLLKVLLGRGARVVRVDFLQPIRVEPKVARLADEESECRAAADWAAGLLRRSPGSRVRIAVADFPRLGSRLAEHLDRVLHPDWVGSAWGDRERTWAVAGGQSLQKSGLAAAALALLELATTRGRLGQARLGEFLRGPYWAADVGEADVRARIERELRKSLPPECGAGEWLRAAAAVAERCPAPGLAVACGQLIDARRQWSGRHSLSEWAARFRTLLDATGWPGERRLSAAEAVQQEALYDCLHDLAALDTVAGRVSAAEALRELRRAVRRAMWRTRRQRPAAVEAGPLDIAPAGPVDGLWVTGLCEGTWPPPGRPNPLLPALLQRRAGIPEASPEARAAIAAEVFSAWSASAGEVVLSWAESREGRPQRPSAMLAGLPVHDVVESLPGRSAALVEFVDDLRGPPLPAGDVVGGGTGVLKAQAICPAWAFFRYRLGAAALPEPTFGFSAQQRGSLLHAALEVFWSGRDSAEVSGWPPRKTEDEIARAARLGIDAFLRTVPRTLGERQRRLEEARLTRLLAAWLPVDLKRGQPFSVDACESAHWLDVDRLRVRVAVDRIDRLADGRLVIIDYKSGARVSAASWADERIAEPQLPIYASLLFPGQPVAAVALARVTPDKPGFVGVADEDGLLPGVPALVDDGTRFPPATFADWATLRSVWAERLGALAREVVRGEAGVRVSDEKALVHCEVLPLLRLAERRMQWGER